MLTKIKTFIRQEAVLCIAALCAVATMVLVPPDREYLGYIDFRVLCLLLSLMAVVAGFRSAGAFQWLTAQLLRRIRSGHFDIAEAVDVPTRKAASREELLARLLPVEKVLADRAR